MSGINELTHRGFSKRQMTEKLADNDIEFAPDLNVIRLSMDDLDTVCDAVLPRVCK
jgi:hypothetical protein